MHPRDAVFSLVVRRMVVVHGNCPGPLCVHYQHQQRDATAARIMECEGLKTDGCRLILYQPDDHDQLESELVMVAISDQVR